MFFIEDEGLHFYLLNNLFVTMNFEAFDFLPTAMALLYLKFSVASIANPCVKSVLPMRRLLPWICRKIKRIFGIC
jgi:hypothetical protein